MGGHAKNDGNESKTGTSQKKVGYVLSGKAVCGLCGHRLVGENRRSRDTDYSYYVCNEEKREKDYSKKAFKKEELAAKAMEILNGTAFSIAYIEKPTGKILTSTE